MDEKTEELIAWLKVDPRWSYIDRNDVLATLAEQAQEIERLRCALGPQLEHFGIDGNALLVDTATDTTAKLIACENRAEDAEARVRELGLPPKVKEGFPIWGEGTKGRSQEDADLIANMAAQLATQEAQLATIEATTIERCVQIWQTHAGRMSIGQITVECRALKRTQDTNRP